MEFSLLKADVNFDKLPDSIKALHLFWVDLYDRCPFVAVFVIVMIPIIIMYSIYTFGTIHRQERSTDMMVKGSYSQTKKKGRKKK